MVDVSPAPETDLGREADARGWWRGASSMAGAVAAGFAVAVGELASGLLSRLPSPLLVVADGVVAGSPPVLTDWAIDGLGAQSTTVLQISVVVVLGLAGGALGSIAHGRPRAATVGVVALASVVPAVSLARGQDAVGALVVAGVVALAGIAALHLLVGRARPLGAPVRATPVGRREEQPSGVERRRFLQSTLTVVAGAVVAGGGGRWLAAGAAVEEGRAAVDLPTPPDPLAAPPPGASLDIGGITPLYTPNDDFYVVDTAVRRPRVDPSDWRLAITGLVDRPLSLDYADLLNLATDEADVLLSCVSNEVGGDLAGVARWQGIRLDDLLDRAGLRPGAEQLMGRSVDGFTAGFPVEVLDGRDAIVAVGMNGEPLPVDHGFPARLVVPGLYGYVSATKWLEEIRLTTWDVDGYWVPRGWAKEGPTKIASRIDRPGSASVEPGIVTLAGVAWAPMAGVAGVEVRVDDGSWQGAQLAEAIGPASWRQWWLEWQAPRGEHRVAVRAIDGDGVIQTAAESDPRPDGATGHHRVTVRVRS